MSIQNFGFDAFDFEASIDSDVVTAEWNWSLPVNRAGESLTRPATLAVHQYDTNVGEETVLRYRFKPTPSAVDIGGWDIRGYLAKAVGTAAPIISLVGDDEIEIVDETLGWFDVICPIKGEDGVSPDRYVLSLYRYDVQWELARVYLTVKPTGIAASTS